MMLVIRNTSSGTMGLYSGKKAFEELGIPTKIIDVEGNQQLISRMSDATKIINEHLVEQFNLQGGLNKPTNPNADQDATKTWGKVLVYCESGNERSPAMIVAYLMEMYGVELISAIQYVQQQRFCVSTTFVILFFHFQPFLENGKAFVTQTNFEMFRSLSMMD
jgi:serine/threonine/tyrosine-interacting protein